MTASPVFIALSAFGADVVRKLGQGRFFAVAAAAGAAGVEVRRELFVEAAPPLARLKELATATGLRLFYSAPFELFDADGALAGDALAALIAEAETLGAEVLKFSLGHAPADADLTELASRLAGVRVRILIENDQTQQGGRLGPLADFLARARADGLPLGLTFDVGNWRWTGEDALEAARVLGPHVAYVHCKAGVERDGGLVAEPFDPADPAPAQIFARFAPGLPRAIEYPIVGDDLDRATRMHVARLAAL